MDLIYTNPDREDLGVLFDYEFDLAFGSSENNFECKVQMDNHCMEPGSFLYIEGTEYGGIVDSVAVDTENKTVTYSGRTWHGILAGNVIEPGKEQIETVIDIPGKPITEYSDSGRLPDGYTELEYIESSGTQYIDTGITPTTTLETEIVLLPTSGATSEHAIFGSAWSISGYFLMFYQDIVRWHSRGVNVDVSGVGLTNRITVTASPTLLDVNGTAYPVSGTGKDTTNNVYLFYTGDDSTSGNKGHFKLYSCRMWDNENLVRDFMPVQRSDGAVGLYDLVNGVFYGNSGSGVFIAGPEAAYKPLQYIESSGTQYIDTEFKPNQDTRVVMDFHNSGDYSGMTTGLCPLFGARNASTSACFAMWIGKTSYPHYGNVAYNKNGSFTTDLNARLIYDFNKNVASIGGDSITCASATFTTNYNLCILTANNYGSIDSRHASGKLYSCQIYDNGTIVRDFVPVQRRDGALGLYDKVNFVFYENAGSGVFVAGDEVLSDPTYEVIPGEVKYDYHVVNGEANTVIRDLIEYLGLSNIFTADEAESGILVKNYHFERYTDAYKGIRKMLAEFGGKLKLTYKRDTVILSAVPLVDYSLDEEFDASQVDFQVKKNFRPVNHLICLGSGNLKDRHVIHLFSDEYGGIQPYKTTENPVCDGDYILDKSNQVLFGVEEVADVYDYSSAQTTENYIRLEEQPDDWATKYADYFTQDETSSFVNVEGVPEDVYTALTEQPGDWAKKFASYFYLTEEGKFKTVEAVTTDTYIKQTAKPADWETNYANYFTYFTDGVVDHWNPVQADKATRYLPQTKQPSDWQTNYKNYYDSPWGSPVDPDENKSGKEITPSWEPKRFYTAEDYDVAPEWKSGTYYTLNSTTGAPDFVPGNYYSMQTIIVNPPFAKKKYFRKEFDHFKEMLVGALDKMQEFFNCDSVSIDLDLEGVYDIGDIVGATEHETGVAVWQPITKKIVSISNNKESINYEIGVIQYG